MDGRKGRGPFTLRICKYPAEQGLAQHGCRHWICFLCNNRYCYPVSLVPQADGWSVVIVTLSLLWSFCCSSHFSILELRYLYTNSFSILIIIQLFCCPRFTTFSPWLEHWLLLNSINYYKWKYQCSRMFGPSNTVGENLDLQICCLTYLDLILSGVGQIDLQVSLVIFATSRASSFLSLSADATLIH